MSSPDTKLEIPEGSFAPASPSKGYPVVEGQPCQGSSMPQGQPLVPGQPYQCYPMPQGQPMGQGAQGYPTSQGQVNVAYQPLAQNPVTIPSVHLTGRAGLTQFVGKYVKYLIACRCGAVCGACGIVGLMPLIIIIIVIASHGGDFGGVQPAAYVFMVLPVICLAITTLLCCYVKKGYNKYKVEAAEERKQQNEVRRAQVEEHKEKTEYYRSQNQMLQQQQQQQQQQYHQQQHQQYQQQQQFQNLGTA